MTLEDFKQLKPSERSEKLKSFKTVTKITTQIISDAALTDENENIRGEAIDTIARLKPQACLPVIDKIFSDPVTPAFLKKRCLDCDAVLNAGNTFDVLEDVCRTSDDQGVLHKMINLLVGLKPDTSLKLLIILAEKKDREVRGHALRSFPILIHAANDATRKEARDLLYLKAKKDTDASVRKACFGSIAAVPGPHADLFIACLKTEKDQKNRTALISTLGTLEEPEIFAACLRLVFGSTTLNEAKTAAHTLSENHLQLAEKLRLVDELLENGHGAAPTADPEMVALSIGSNNPASRHAFGEHLIRTFLERKSHRSNPSFTSRLIIRCHGGDNVRAGNTLNDILEESEYDPDVAQELRIALGGQTSLQPILDELKRALDEDFSGTVGQLNEKTLSSWQTSIRYTQIAFWVRTIMSGLVFVTGLFFTVMSTWMFLRGTQDSAAIWGAGTSMVGGFTAMFAVIYAGPLKDVKKTIDDLNDTGIRLIGFTHQILQVSLFYRLKYLKEEIDVPLIKDLTLIIETAQRKGLTGMQTQVPKPESTPESEPKTEPGSIPEPAREEPDET